MTILFPKENAEAQECGPKVGVFLSGGGALGFAHIGMLQALEEAGISPEYVSGASMGALVGAFYSAGNDPQQIKEIVMKEKLYILHRNQSARAKSAPFLSLLPRK